MEDCKKKKLIRITTVPISLKILLKGQLPYMSQYYDVIAISSKEGLEEALREQRVKGYGVNMTRKITPFQDLVALVQLIRIFLLEKPDIVHTHTPKAGLLGMLAAWVTRVPHRLHTVAGLPLLVTTGNKRRLLEFVEKLTYACATHVYPNSSVMKELILSMRLTRPSKLKVIANGSSNGIDTSFFSPQSVERNVTNAPRKKFTFIFVGRLVKDKGINELVSAFVELHKLYKDTSLLLVGPLEERLDPLKKATLDFIKNNDDIISVGFQKDVRPYFMKADILTFPSYREGFPNVVMQAGAMGLPSIVTDINGCNEIIQKDVNGLIIPTHDEKALYEAMKWCYEHQNDEVLRMRNVARKMIKDRYEQHIIWEALLNEYQSFNG